MNATIAVDAGQLAVRVRARTDDGETVVADFPGLMLAEPLAQQWAAAITGLLEQHPRLRPEEVGVSTSPVQRFSAHELLPLVTPLGIHRVAVTSDGVAAYIGALGEQEGAVIHASTVTVCIACGPRGSAQVDGWGPIFGNVGSAFWIGRNALEAAFRGYDGRRQLTALTEVVRADFPELEHAHVELTSAPDAVTRIAAYAAKVDALAATDRVAANILDKAAAHLSESVQAAIRRAGLTRPDAPKVVALGSVFDSARVRTRFCDYLTLQWPNFALTEPAGDELDGAEALHTLRPSHPLFGRVSYAAR